MQIRIFVILFITFNTFSNFVSGQLKPQAPPTQSHLEAKALRESYNKPKPLTPAVYTPPKSTYTPPKTNASSPTINNTSINNASTPVKPEKPKTPAELKRENDYYNSKFPIEGMGIGSSVCLYDPKTDSFNYGYNLGAFNDINNKTIYLAWLEPDKVYQVFYSGQNTTLYKKYDALQFRFNSADELRLSIQAELLEKRIDKYMSETSNYMKSANFNTTVSFIKPEDAQLNKLTTGYKLNAVHQGVLSFSGMADSIFILTDSRSDAASYKYYDLYFVDVRGKPIGRLLASFTGKEIWDAAQTSGSSSFYDFYFTESRKKLYDIAVKEKFAPRQKAYEEQEQKRMNKLMEESDKRNLTQRDTRLKEFRATKKPLGAIIKNTTDHSFVHFYNIELLSYDIQKNEFEGYRLSIKAKDSIFLLYESGDNLKVYLIDQRKNPDSDEGIHFPENKFWNVYSLFAETGTSKNQPIYQEDIIKIIERKIYQELKRKIPKELDIDKNQLQGIVKTTEPIYDFAWGLAFLMNKFNENGFLLKLEKDNSFRGLYDGYGIYIDPYGTKYFGHILPYDNSDNDGHSLKSGYPSITIKQNGEMVFSTNDFTYGSNTSFLMDKKGKVSILNRDWILDAGSVKGLGKENIRETEFAKVIAYGFDNRRVMGSGLIQYKNGDIYFGHINDSLQKDHRGVLLKANGDMYMGNFENDKIFDLSPAIYFFNNGSIYQGAFVNEKMEIYGEFYDNDTRERYIGPFKDGKKHGFGFIKSIDGTSKRVIYKDGVMQQ